MSGPNAQTTTVCWADLPNNADSRWWRDKGLRSAAGIVGLYMLAQATGGYDKSLLNNLQTMPSWRETMDNPSGGSLGILTAMLSIGVIAGSPVFGWLSDFRGRRITMVLGCFIMLVGAIVQAAAQDRSYFLGGRFAIGFGVAGTLCSGPLLAAEIAHPRQRATVGAFYNTFWYVGSIVCAWLSFGTGFLSSDWAWRIPCIGQGVPALVLICCWRWLPESPRYLVMSGRKEEAQKLLAKYHSNGQLDDPLVLFEITEIEEVLAFESAYKHDTLSQRWLKLVSTKSYTRRFLIITGLVVAIDWCGQSITSYYLAKVLNLVGITSTTQQTGINGGLQILNWTTAVSGAILSGHVRRRPLWLFSFAGMLASNIPFAVCSGVFAKTGSKNAGRAVIAFAFLYNATYNIGVCPLTYLYCVEILPYDIRAQGLAWEVGWEAVHGVATQYVFPIGLDALEWKFYFCFTGFLSASIVFIYFCFPETSGYTLEEISEIFGDAQQVRESMAHAIAEAHGRSDGDVSAEKPMVEMKEKV